MRPHRSGLGGPSRGLLLVLWTLAASSGCGDGSASAPTSAVESLLARARTEHFEVHAGLASDDTVAQIAAGLEARYAPAFVRARYFGAAGLTLAEPVQ